MSTKRDALRSKGLETRPPKSQIVIFDGTEYEVRAPSVRARTAIMDRAGIFAAATDKTGKSKYDPGSMQAAAVIACTYVPRSEEEVRQGVEPERVFDDADFEELITKPAGDITDVLGEVALKFVNLSDDKDAAKNG